MSTQKQSVALSTGEQIDALEEARELIDEDDGDLVDVDRPRRGPAAGDVPDGEVVRIACLAYLGRLPLGESES